MVQDIGCEAELILATLMESQQTEPLSQLPSPLLWATWDRPLAALSLEIPLGMLEVSYLTPNVHSLLLPACLCCPKPRSSKRHLKIHCTLLGLHEPRSKVD